MLVDLVIYLLVLLGLQHTNHNDDYNRVENMVPLFSRNFKILALPKVQPTLGFEAFAVLTSSCGVFELGVEFCSMTLGTMKRHDPGFILS